LATGNEMKKTNPDICEFFKKNNINVIEIAMSKFHTIFRSSEGQVYTCGFGMDGRLGHNDELTLMQPKIIESLKSEKCIRVAASRNNSYFLTSEGILYSCGTNEFKQLGQPAVAKSLSPKSISVGRLLKNKRIKLIECSRFHCVLVTHSNELYTFGLNAGQLGHPNEQVQGGGASSSYNNNICYVGEPRLVTSLNEPDLQISLIACSDACTVCIESTKNIMYICNDYKCKRSYYVKETGSPFRKVRVHGGKLDSFSANSNLKWIASLSEPLIIVGLTHRNLLYIWREQDVQWRAIICNNGKRIEVHDFDLNTSGLILCTIHGNCYKGEFSKAVKMGGSKNAAGLSSETLELTQLPFVNRCFYLCNEIKARNFFALQHQPNVNMRYYPRQASSEFRQNMQNFFDESTSIRLSENTMTSEQENFASYYESNGDDLFSFINCKSYDIELMYRSSSFGLHKFILLSRCPKFFLKMNLTDLKQLDMEVHLNNATSQQQQQQKHYAQFILELLVKYIYTNEFRLNDISRVIELAKLNNEAVFIKFMSEFKEIAIEKLGNAHSNIL
jgi:inhibitor of Bruton tyrosine kinase